MCDKCDEEDGDIMEKVDHLTAENAKLRDAAKRLKDDFHDLATEKDRLLLQLSEEKAKFKAYYDSSVEAGLAFATKLQDANRLNGELLALVKKIDAFFENPRILAGKSALILDIPYEIAAGVKAVLTTPLKPKGADGVCPLCYHNYNDPAGKCPDHAEKRNDEVRVGENKHAPTGLCWCSLFHG